MTTGMKKIIISALAFASCSVGGIGDRAVVIDNKVTIANVNGLPADATMIKVNLEDTATGVETELVSADIADGTAVVYLPAAIDDRYLNLVRDEAPPEVKLSDNGLQYTFIRFMVYDTEGRRIGYLALESSTSWTDLIYADRPCTVTGKVFIVDSDGNENSDIYDLRLVKGYNWTRYVTSASAESWLSGIPSGAVWNYYSYQL
jgi:hypothetical protein